MFSELDGVAPLVTDPPRANLIPLLCEKEAFIFVTEKASLRVKKEFSSIGHKFANKFIQGLPIRAGFWCKAYQQKV